MQHLFVIGAYDLEPFPLLGLRVWLLLLLRDLLAIVLVLGQNANGVIGLLDYWYFGQDSCFELPLLFVIGFLLDVLDLEPWVIEQVLCCCSRVIIDIQATLQDVKVFPCDLLVVYVVGSSLDSAIQIVISLPSEWEAAVQEGIEQHTGGPDISWWAGILNFGDNLRCHVRRCATEHPNLLVVWNAGGEPKVDELDVLILIE